MKISIKVFGLEVFSLNAKKDSDDDSPEYDSSSTTSSEMERAGKPMERTWGDGYDRPSPITFGFSRRGKS